VPDHPGIVVDEVIGMWITAWMLDFNSWIGPLIAFILFRVLDIFKPMPIRWVDRWSKGQVVHARGSPTGAWWAGFGVMADDLVAGVLALLILYFTRWVHA
jgi:phosphatidylglycerophosphatase A